MNIVGRKQLVALIAASAFGVWGGAAMAGPVTSCGGGDIAISLGNSALSGFTGPFACVTVTFVDATHASITFSSIQDGTDVFLMGGTRAADLNVNASSFSVGAISGSNSGSGFTPGGYSTGSGNVNGFGSFDLTIDSFDGFTHSADTISFSLTDLSGTWSNAADVLAANADGNSVAAHSFVTTYPANSGNGAIVTGFSTGGPSPSEVPEPSSLALIGIGMLGLVLSSRWARRRSG